MSRSCLLPELRETNVCGSIDANQPRAASPHTGEEPERRSGLTLREFIAQYRVPRRPVILEDATSAWRARQWTLDSIAARAGHRQITIRTQQGSAQLTLGELTDQVARSTPANPAPYGRNIDVERELPELWPDIRPRIAYAARDWKSSRLLPADLVFRNGLEEMFIGGAGARFPVLHVDYWGMDGFLSQLYGEKEVVLFGPEQTPFLYPDPHDPLVSRVDLERPDLQRYPLFREARAMRFVLHPGDTLYMPHGWWHTTRMHVPSISIVTATWHRENWREFLRQYRRCGPERRWRKGLRLARLAGAGACLAICEMLDR